MPHNQPITNFSNTIFHTTCPKKYLRVCVCVSILASILSHGCFSFHLPYTLSVYSPKEKKNYAQRETTKTVTKNIPPFIIKFPICSSHHQQHDVEGPLQANTHTHIYACEQKNFSYSGVAAAADRLTITIENPNICTFFHRNSYRETSHDDPQLFQCMLCIRIIFRQWETPRYISFFDAQK